MSGKVWIDEIQTTKEKFLVIISRNINIGNKTSDSACLDLAIAKLKQK